MKIIEEVETQKKTTTEKTNKDRKEQGGKSYSERMRTK